ncbi:MAG: tetratricopeptide repeat protein, partial [Ignavibacteria bacterium]
MSRKPPIPLPKRGAATKGAPGAFERALAFLRQGNLPQAHALCERIISAQPRHALAWHLLGAIELQRGEPALALRRFDSALAIETGDAGMHNSRGNALVRLQRYEEALASLDRCLALQPRHAEAQHTRGGVLFRLARYEEALAAFEGALAIEPGSVMTWNSHGSALVRLGRREAARESFRRAAELAPHHPLAHYNLGCVLGELGQREAAVACFERAVALEPRHAEAHNNLGVALAALGRCEAALVSHDAAVRLKPDVPENQLNRGVTLERLGRHAEARECYEAAVARAPDNARAHWNLALNCLLTGDFARGWEHFEWRWRYRRADEPCAQRPRWTGAEPLAGKTILLVAEQGLGDTLQFCRYAALLAERGASVVLCVPHPLVALLATLPGAPRVLAEGDPLPDFDYCCPMMSLPRAFGTTLASIPGEVPYLSADPDKCAAWAARIGPREGLRAGLV